MRSARTSAALQFLIVGVALGLIAAAVVAAIEVGRSEPVKVDFSHSDTHGLNGPLDVLPSIASAR